MDYKEQAEAQLRAADFDKFALSDLSAFQLPDGEPQYKFAAFLQYVKNPYLFRVGDIGVHISFSGKDGDTLQRRLCSLFSDTI